MGLISRVSSRTYRLNLIKIIMSANAVAQPKGIYRHPYVWNGVADARVHKLPADGRLLRDVKVAEVPGWMMSRNVSPVGLWYTLKRAMMRSMTIHHSDKAAVQRFTFFQTKMLPAVGIFYYFMHYSAGHLDLQKNAKHHW